MIKRISTPYGTFQRRTQRRYEYVIIRPNNLDWMEAHRTERLSFWQEMAARYPDSDYSRDIARHSVPYTPQNTAPWRAQTWSSSERHAITVAKKLSRLWGRALVLSAITGEQFYAFREGR